MHEAKELASNAQCTPGGHPLPLSVSCGLTFTRHGPFSLLLHADFKVIRTSSQDTMRETKAFLSSKRLNPPVARDCYQQGMIDGLKTNSLWWLSRHSWDPSFLACWESPEVNFTPEPSTGLSFQVEDSVTCSPHRNVCWAVLPGTRSPWSIQRTPLPF